MNWVFNTLWLGWRRRSPGFQCKLRKWFSLFWIFNRIQYSDALPINIAQAVKPYLKDIRRRKRIYKHHLLVFLAALTLGRCLRHWVSATSVFGQCPKQRLTSDTSDIWVMSRQKDQQELYFAMLVDASYHWLSVVHHHTITKSNGICLPRPNLEFLHDEIDSCSEHMATWLWDIGRLQHDIHDVWGKF